MNLSVTAKQLFLALLLRCIDSSRAGDPKRSKVEPAEAVPRKFFDGPTSEDEFSLLRPTASTESGIIAGDELSVSRSEDRNVSRDFKASLHLGEIKESRTRAGGPFSDPRRMKFGDQVDRQSFHEHLDDYRLIFEPASYGQQQDRHRNPFEVVATSDGNRDGGAGQKNSHVSFQDNFSDAGKYRGVSGYQYGGSLAEQTFPQRFVHGLNENVATRYEFMDPQLFQNSETPVQGQASFPAESTGNPEAGAANVRESSRSPYYFAYPEQGSPQAGLQGVDYTRGPSNGVVYVQESSFLRTRKFPYAIYQPAVGYQQLGYVNEQYPNYSLANGISPWKKILQLAGAFVPLGLLIAALTPKVVKVSNTSDPNIILSKWRAGDLPLEHKQARFTNSRSVCEERSICELILNGGDDRSNALRNILSNLATRTSTTTAKERGLQDIFEAVKKKDCTNVAC